MLALAAGALVALPVTARAQEPNDAVPPGARVTKIGPQEVVIEHPDGHISKYDDPSQQAPACKSNADCAVKAFGIMALFGAATYEDWTTSVEVAGTSAGPSGPAVPIGAPE
jgi:hypothetical protein